jgi:hypothetical protein
MYQICTPHCCVCASQVHCACTACTPGCPAASASMSLIDTARPNSSAERGA